MKNQAQNWTLLWFKTESPLSKVYKCLHYLSVALLLLQSFILSSSHRRAAPLWGAAGGPNEQPDKIRTQNSSNHKKHYFHKDNSEV